MTVTGGVWALAFVAVATPLLYLGLVHGGARAFDWLAARQSRRRDERGQTMAVEIAKFFVWLVGAALLLIVLQSPFEEVSQQTTNATTNQTALTGLQYSQSVWNNLPAFMLALSAFGLVAVAVFLQRRI